MFTISMVVMVVAIITVVMSVTKDQGAHDVDDQADRSNGNGLRVLNRLRDKEPLDRRQHHESGDSQQENCTGKSGKHFDFPRSEGKALILLIPPCCGVC